MFDYLNARLDAIGVLLSAFCGVHCLAMPLFAATGVLLVPGGAESDLTHYLLFAAAVPVTLLAIWRVIRHRHAWWMWLMGGVGLVAIWLGLSQDSHDFAATTTTLIGASLLAAFHSIHWRMHRHSHHTHSAPHA
jgi:hypothetical protein